MASGSGFMSLDMSIADDRNKVSYKPNAPPNGAKNDWDYEEKSATKGDDVKKEEAAAEFGEGFGPSVTVWEQLKKTKRTHIIVGSVVSIVIGMILGAAITAIIFTQTMGEKKETTSKPVWKQTETSDVGDTTTCELQGTPEAKFTAMINQTVYAYFDSATHVGNYSSAASKCQDFGARLASTGLRQPDVVTSLTGRIQCTGLGDIWVGLRYVNGSWMWSDGVVSDRRNTDWGLNQPNSNAEDCGALDRIWGPWSFHDYPCSSLFPFLCEC